VREVAHASAAPAISNELMPATSATLDHEWSVLLVACSVIPIQEKYACLRPILQLPIRWKALFDLAEQHGALQLLYQALASVAESATAVVPANEMRLLQQSHQLNLRKALLLSRELIRILEHLSSLGIAAMPYKGLALAEAMYGDIALRHSGDIDLLIHPQDFPRVRAAVRDLGFTPHTLLSEAQESAYLKSGYECSFDGTAGPNLLEVQWAILPRFYAIDFDMEGLFQRAVTVTVAGQLMQTPSAEDLFLVLSAHAAKHVWGRLIWLCDLARIMILPNLNWQWIASQAKDLGIVRILQITMLAANRMLGAAIPPAASQAGLSENDPATLALLDEVQTHVANETPYNVESLAYFRLMMRLRERRPDRQRFLQRLIFTPGPGEWAAIRLPRSLFPLYRMVRLSRLAARFLRA
jgi:hypothetical protein